MTGVSKTDWKLFQEKVPIWQERYMEKLIKEYIEMLSNSGEASERFWELEKRIKNDCRHPGVILTLEKKEVPWDIIRLMRLNVINIEDLEGFSDEMKEFVRERLN